MTSLDAASRPQRAGDTSPEDGGLDVGSVIARNTLWNYVGFGVNLVVNFALFPFAVRRLGTGPAGVWLLLGSVTGYMGLLELGIVPALMQRIATALGRGNRAALDETISTAIALMTGMMLLALQVMWLAPAIANQLHLPEGFSSQAVAAIALAIAGVALRMPLAPFQAVLLGCQRQDRCNQLWIALALTKAVATVALVLLQVGVVGIVAMEALAHLAAGVLQIRWVRQELPSLQLSLNGVRLQEARDLLGFGVQVSLAGIFVLIVEQTDKLVIGAFLPIEDVTLYSAAWKLYMLAYAVPTTLIQALSPVLANLYGAGDMERLRTAFYRMTKYSAYEMARQLERAGTPPRSLVLMDTVYPSLRRRVRHQARGWSSRARRWTRSGLRASGLRPSAQESAYRTLSWWLPFAEHEASPLVPEEWLQFVELLLAYRPQPLGLPFTLLATQDLTNTGSVQRWQQLAGARLSVRTLTGTHWSYIRSQVAESGATLRAALEAT